MLLFAPNWLFFGPRIGPVVLGVALVIWLLSGERRLGSISFDINTMFMGMVLRLLGVQTVSVGLFAKVFSYSARFDRQQRSLERWLKHVALEQGHIVGAALMLIGLAGGSLADFLLAVVRSRGSGDYLLALPEHVGDRSQPVHRRPRIQ
jgi:hypothetical protein